MEAEKGNRKGLIILLVVFILMVLGLGGWIAYDKFISNSNTKSKEQTNNEETIESEKESEQKLDSNRYEIVNIDLQVKEKDYNEYLKEEIDSRYDCENCNLIDFNDVEEGLNKKINSIVLDDFNENDDDMDGKKAEDIDNSEKYELKIENGKVVLYISINISDSIDELKIVRKKFVFNTINNPTGIFAYEGIGGEDSLPVEFWVIDNADNIYHAKTNTLYCDKDCGISMVKIVK